MTPAPRDWDEVAEAKEQEYRKYSCYRIGNNKKQHDKQKARARAKAARKARKVSK